MKIINKLLPEFNEIELFAKDNPDLIRIRKLASIQDNFSEFPIYGLEIGTSDRTVPTLGFVGGCHGLEKIGTQVLLSYLYTLKQRLRWDKDLRLELATR